MAEEDVKVRLSAEGVAEVVAAFRKVEAEAQKTGKGMAGAFTSLKGIVGELGRMLPALGAAAVVGGLIAVGKAGLAAADDMGKMASRTGSAVEGLSVLAATAKTADVETAQLSTGLTILSKNLGKVEDGVVGADEGFLKLGLKAEDFKGLSTDQAFVKIAERLGKVEDGTQKTALAMEIFGKSGAQLIPLLNDVANEGIGPLTERARELGLIIDESTAAAAQAANDSFTVIGQQAKGLAVQFASGLAPIIAQTMTQFTNDTAGKGAQAAQHFGRVVGRTVQGVIGVFRILADIVGGVVKIIGNSIGNLAAMLGAVFRGDFSEAVEIWKSGWQDTFRTIGTTVEAVVRDSKRMFEDLTTDPPEFKVRPVVDPEAIRDIETQAEKAARKKDADDAKRAEEKAKREAEAQRREQERLAKEREGFERKLLEMTGRRHEAELRALDEEVAKLDEVLTKQGVADAQRNAQVAAYREAALAQLNATRQLEAVQIEMDTLTRERQRIENELALGLIDQATAQNALKTLEAQRLVIITQLAQQALVAAQATGDPEAIARAQQLVLETQNLKVELTAAQTVMQQFGETAAEAVGDAGVNAFQQAITQAQSFGDIARGAVLSVVGAVQQLAAEMLKAWLVQRLLGGATGGGALGFAEGGFVSGPGTGSSDSIPARLSNGEFVVRASVVRQPGVLSALANLNRGIGSLRGVGVQRFASGGLVAPSGGAPGAGDSAVKVVNVIDPSMMVEALQSPSAERVIVNTIRRNRGSLRQTFGS